MSHQTLSIYRKFGVILRFFVGQAFEGVKVEELLDRHELPAASLR